MKKSISLILALVLCFSFAACAKKNKAAAMAYPISGSIQCLDPQIADTSDELLVVEHCMEGLTRVGQDGSIQPGSANRWEISSDRRQYTFYLRNDAKWHLSTKAQQRMGKDFAPLVTAKDFVFALRRAVSQETNAPYFSNLRQIKNAVKIHSGEASASDLGVQAQNDTTLVITLEEPNDQFLALCASGVMSPCNEEFFNAAKGRYGLDLSLIMFNGPFFLSSWRDSSLVMKPNESYQGDHTPSPSSVSLPVNASDAEILSKFKDGTYDAACLKGSQAAEFEGKSGYTLTPYSDTTWCLLFNLGDPVLSNKNARVAIAQSLNPKGVSVPSYFTQATGLAPGICAVGQTNYRESAGNLALYSNRIMEAASHWNTARSELKKSKSAIVLTLLCSTDQEEAMKQLLQSVQQSLGLSLTMKLSAVPREDLENQLKKKNYQLAFAPIQAVSDNTYDYFLRFTSGHAGNTLNYASKDYDRLVSQMESATSAQTLLTLYKQAENRLIQDCALAPMYFESNYYAVNRNIKNVYFHNNGGRVNFIQGEKIK